MSPELFPFLYFNNSNYSKPGQAILPSKWHISQCFREIGWLIHCAPEQNDGRRKCHCSIPPLSCSTRILTLTKLVHLAFPGNETSNTGGVECASRAMTGFHRYMLTRLAQTLIKKSSWDPIPYFRRWISFFTRNHVVLSCLTDSHHSRKWSVYSNYIAAPHYGSSHLLHCFLSFSAELQSGWQ